MQVFEISFECGNKVGGIHTVISTKSKEVIKKYGEDYICIGFYDQKKAVSEVIFENVPKEWISIFEDLEEKGIKCYYGKWVKGNGARIILVDAKEFEKNNINKIKTDHWEKYKIDSLLARNDYEEPIAWAHACGILIEKIGNFPYIAHFHEWLSGAALLYLEEKMPNIPTVFTTHATFLSRVIGANIEKIRILEESEIEDLAKKHNIIAKHQMEKISANKAKVVTTVSDITKEEVEKILSRKVDIITYNAIDFSSLKKDYEIIAESANLRLELDKFLISYFTPYYNINVKDKPIIFTSGRYEFWNKGFDLFIESLGRLNKRLKGKTTVFAFILVPTDIKKPKEIILDNLLLFNKFEEIIKKDFSKIRKEILYKYALGEKINEFLRYNKELIVNINTMKNMMKKEGLPEICPFYLNYDEKKDLILQNLKRIGLDNKEENSVKVIFYPRFLIDSDEILKLNYIEFLKVADIGVFLSKYEPFGYTPLETMAYVTCAVTSDYSGFGNLIRNLKKENQGVWIINAVNKNKEIIVEELTNLLEWFCLLDKEKRKDLEIKARDCSEFFDWKNFINNYFIAYNLALERAGINQ